MKNINLLLTFFLSACVDVEGVPFDGQVYKCTLSHPDGSLRSVVEKCGPWDDWQVAADATRADHPGLFVLIDCRGTFETCAYEAP